MEAFSKGLAHQNSGGYARKQNVLRKRLAGNALASRCGQGARTRTSDGDEDSTNGCNGGTHEECDRGGPAGAGHHKALTVCTLPVTRSP